ncbi:hypothetical protein FF36_06410 [Frankia torreyi]|uniref:Uncharacterized protein n=2 Tax=Frankia TaxID=1854 RepID=A0A0D8B568_9ACTN|nr:MULTISPECIES: hypothetical protein [Frankia]KJE19321.1 hypothetical protein FF36_06410 [Frankia torreyi]KQM01735.1 hypothetical protein FF86_11172 [Frankia sp. CpI1-P]
MENERLEKLLQEKLRSAKGIRAVRTAEEAEWAVRPAGIVIETGWGTVYVAAFHYPGLAGGRETGPPLAPLMSATAEEDSLTYICALLVDATYNAESPEIKAVTLADEIAPWAYRYGIFVEYYNGARTYLIITDQQVL